MACIAHAYSTNYAKLVATICIVAAISGLWRLEGWRVCCSPWVLGFEPVEKSVLVEGSGGCTVAVVSLDVCNSVRVFHHFDETRFIPG